VLKISPVASREALSDTGETISGFVRVDPMESGQSEFLVYAMRLAIRFSIVDAKLE
jgi:hypothetical protein